MNAIRDTIIDVIERAEEAKQTWERHKNPMEYGRLLAFCEVLSALKTDFVGVAEIEKLLDFDIDKRFICE